MKIVGVLRGGAGETYESSLREGGNVISFLTENLSDKYKPVDILIDKAGIWHISGMPVLPSDVPQRVDIVWNTAPSGYTRVLKSFSVPHLSISPFSESIQTSRTMLREHMQKMGIHLPRHVLLSAYQGDFDGPVERYAFRKAKEVFEKFGAPWVVKSFPESKNLGVRVVKTFQELVEAIMDLALKGESVEVEELVSDRSAEVHTIPGFRGEDLYALPVEGFSGAEKEKIISLAKDLYQHLGAEHYLNAHFSIHPRRGVFLTRVRLLPDLGKNSHLHQTCELIGVRAHHIIEHMLSGAK